MFFFLFFQIVCCCLLNFIRAPAAICTKLDWAYFFSNKKQKPSNICLPKKCAGKTIEDTRMFVCFLFCFVNRQLIGQFVHKNNQTKKKQFLCKSSVFVVALIYIYIAWGQTRKNKNLIETIASENIGRVTFRFSFVFIVNNSVNVGNDSFVLDSFHWLIKKKTK